MAVLIVDDRPNGRLFQRKWLQAQFPWKNDAFIECGTLAEAIAAARSNAIDFVVLDLNLGPQDRGVTTLKRFLAESGVAASKVFVSTADSDDFELVRECLALGVADVNNSGQPPWAMPPKIFTDEQLAELQKRITESVGASVKAMIATEFQSLQEEQARRDKVKQAEGILTAVRVVAGVVAGAFGTWLLSTALPISVKAVLVSILGGGKTQ